MVGIGIGIGMGKFLVWFSLFVALLLAVYYIGLLPTLACVIVSAIVIPSITEIYCAINTHKIRSEFAKEWGCNELKI